MADAPAVRALPEKTVVAPRRGCFVAARRADCAPTSAETAVLIVTKLTDVAARRPVSGGPAPLAGATVSCVFVRIK
ncbi:hypothetical protein MB901379_04304 [Mycobacterium basiliense]|uniref:Uncharacterized protein n=1 Tax=Mycobacterium basiliense TaxID=2094119 RepID=A0A3S4CEU1_9MYCO|nr:hypothetical protein MB901379_04304 [Mycobacterium basiliense]